MDFKSNVTALAPNAAALDSELRCFLRIREQSAHSVEGERPSAAEAPARVFVVHRGMNKANMGSPTLRCKNDLNLRVRCRFAFAGCVRDELGPCEYQTLTWFNDEILALEPERLLFIS